MKKLQIPGVSNVIQPQSSDPKTGAATSALKKAMEIPKQQMNQLFESMGLGKKLNVKA